MIDDRDIFDGADFMERMDNDEDLARTILDRFLVDMRLRIDQLRLAFVDGSMEEFRSLAHTVKGAAATVSAWKLSRAAGLLEKAAMERAMEECALRLEETGRFLDELDACLSRGVQLPRSG